MDKVICTCPKCESERIAERQEATALYPVAKWSVAPDNSFVEPEDYEPGKLEFNGDSEVLYPPYICMDCGHIFAVPILEDIEEGD